MVPVTGQRHSVKIFGAVAVDDGQFAYGRDRVFNADTYLHFLEQTMAPRFYRRGRRVIYIQDNASYHKDGQVWEWFGQNRRWLEVHLLPPYSPELNAAEPLWHHTRVQGTHNRYFQDEQEIVESLDQVFQSMQREPMQILGYLRPFQ